MPKKIFTQELEKARRRGRPRKGCREEAERDLQVLGVRRWRELVIDREKWRGIVQQAKPTAGCSANGRRRRIFYSQYSHQHVSAAFAAIFRVILLEEYNDTNVGSWVITT